MPRSPSSEKPVGSECTTSRSAFSACLAPAASTRLMSAASTSWPPRLIEAAKVSLFSRPAATLTIRESTVSPAMRSAASTASRIACSALSRSTTTPDFTPRDFWWPMPMTCDLMGAAAQQLAFADRLQPGDHAAHLARADVEHGDDAGAARRAVLLGAEPAHIFFPGFDLVFMPSCARSSRRCGATAASGVSCTTSRSANRMSTAAMSRDSRPASRSIVASCVDAPGPRRVSGNLTVTPFSSRTSQRRSATRM